MAAKHTLHVALTEALVRHVRDQVATGRDATASDVAREAVQVLIGRDTRRQRNGLKVGMSALRHG